MKKSEEREPISRHMGFSSSIASYNPHPHHNTGKQKERTKMTHNIEDKYKITYRFVHDNGNEGTEFQQTMPLYSLPTLLGTISDFEVSVKIMSCEKVTE